MAGSWIPALIAAMLVASGAGAPTRDEPLRSCAGLGGEAPDARVKACSAVIAGGQAGGDRLAAVFFDRANAYVAMGELWQAVADYDQVIRRRPPSAIAFTNRGSVFHRLEQYGRAIQDFDQALTLSPSDALAL